MRTFGEIESLVKEMEEKDKKIELLTCQIADMKRTLTRMANKEIVWDEDAREMYAYAALFALKRCGW